MPETPTGRLTSWILGVAVSIIMFLGGMVMTDARDRITKLEASQGADQRVFFERNERIARLETQNAEILRRLDDLREQLKEDRGRR